MKIRGSIFSHKFFAYLLALYLFNYSIDGKDAQPDHIPEDLTHNDIESILEFTLESVLGIEDAMKEHDEHDDHDGSIARHHVVYYEQALPVPPLSANDANLVSHRFRSPLLYVPLSYLEIISPPPRA